MIEKLTPTVTLPYTNNGITYSYTTDGKIQISGTASGNSSLYYYNNRSALPSWFAFDTTIKWYQNKTGSGTTRLRMYMYDATNTAHSVFYSTQQSGTFNVAASTGYVGMRLYTYITTGTTVNAVIEPWLEIPGPYQPRFSSTGIRYSPYWYSLNPFYNASNPNPPPPNFGLPNCTCYAWGRFWEISDPNKLYDSSTRPRLSTGNAQDWFNHTSDGYVRGQTPKLGAICCYSGGIYSGLGHVCVVEEIYSDGSFLVSESAWSDYFFRAIHVVAANGDYGYGGYTFQGFIYNPYAGDTDTPPYIEGGNFHLILAKRALQRAKGELIL